MALQDNSFVIDHCKKKVVHVTDNCRKIDPRETEYTESRIRSTGPRRSIIKTEILRNGMECSHGNQHDL